MNTTKDAILRGLSKSQKGRERRVSNFYNSPAYPDKLIRLFNSAFRSKDYGEPPPISKQIKNMLNGFIKVCRGSNWPERKIYETINLLVTHWEFIKKQEHSTLKGKRALLGDRPSLLEFLICRETILSAIHRAQREDIIDPIISNSNVEVVKRKSHVPNDSDLEREYKNLIDYY